jgi:HSP20 family molecular chaperone IbpA
MSSKISRRHEVKSSEKIEKDLITYPNEERNSMTKTFTAVYVNLTEARRDLVLHAAMPGAEPENILITFEGTTLTLHCTMRGKVGADKTALLHEWHIGEYHRVVKLPFPVDSNRTNATYNNGVLTISMPKSQSPTEAGQLKVKKVKAERGQTRRHSGSAQG